MTPNPAPSARTTSVASGRRIGGIAGIAYVVLVAVENLDTLTAPGRGSAVAEIIEANRAPNAKLGIHMTAGLLALVAYVVGAVALASVARDRTSDHRDVRTLAGLAAAITGTALGAVALALQSAIIVGVHNGASTDAITRLHDARLTVQMLGALPVGVFLLAVSLSGIRSGRLPHWLTGAGVVVGSAAAIASFSVIASTDTARATVLTALAASIAWFLAASVWLLLSSWRPAQHDSPRVTTARVLAGTVAVAAGVSGVALLAFPGSTPDFFSWGLAPAPLASLLGAFYVASSLVYARAAIAPWSDLRVMVVGIVALTVPVFVSTFAHLEVFDFGRLQAWAWVVLFGGFLVAAVAVIAATHDPPRRSTRFHPAARFGAGVLAVALLGTSIALWVDPVASDVFLPFTPAPLSGRVLGGWTFLLGVLAGSIVAEDDRRAGRLPALALAAFPASALLAAVRSVGDLTPGGAWPITLAGVVAWSALGLALVRQSGRAELVVAPDVPGHGMRSVTTTARWSLTDAATTSASTMSAPLTAT